MELGWVRSRLWRWEWCSPRPRNAGSYRKLRDRGRILPQGLQEAAPGHHRFRPPASRTETISFCCSEPPNYGNLLPWPQDRSQIHAVSFIPRNWVFHADLNGTFNFSCKWIIVSTEKCNWRTDLVFHNLANYLFLLVVCVRVCVCGGCAFNGGLQVYHI